MTINWSTFERYRFAVVYIEVYLAEMMPPAIGPLITWMTSTLSDTCSITCQIINCALDIRRSLAFDKTRVPITHGKYSSVHVYMCEIAAGTRVCDRTCTYICLLDGRVPVLGVCRVGDQQLEDFFRRRINVCLVQEKVRLNGSKRSYLAKNVGRVGDLMLY